MGIDNNPKEKKIKIHDDKEDNLPKETDVDNLSQLEHSDTDPER